MEIEYTPVRKRSVVVGNLKTSISIEDCFWLRLKAIAARRNIGLAQLLADIDFDRPGGVGNLSSAVRQFVAQDLRERIDTLETRLAIVLPSEAAQANAA